MAEQARAAGRAHPDRGEERGKPTIFDRGLPPRKGSLRQLPGLAGTALRMVWAAGRKEFATTLALQVLAGGAMAAAVVVGQDALAGVLAAHRDGGGLEDFLPSVVLLAVLTTAVGVLRSVETARRELLQELTARHVEERVLDVACAAELEAFERPHFHDRLARAQANGRIGPFTLVYGLTQLLRAAAGSAGLAAALLALQPLLLPLALLAVVPAWLDTRRRAQSHVHFAFAMTPRDRERTYLSHLLSSRDTAQEIRAFDLAAFLRRRHGGLWDERLCELRAVIGRWVRLSLLASLASALALGGALTAIVALALEQRVSLADAGAAAAATLLLVRQLNSAGFGAGELYRAALFVEDFRSFIESVPERRPRRARREAASFPKPLAAEEVTFTYPSADRPALHGVTLRIEPGEVVALVGENGSGKTTLAKVLSGLYSPDEGRLLWDGRVLDDDAARAELRDCVAIIFQDFIKYSLSARDNIVLGRHERYGDLPAMLRAAGRAGADEAIEPLPSGYETQLGPQFYGGTELSSGQWQRIALARAFFRDAPLLILDEPTAALDARAEHELFASLGNLLADRSALVISHRFSSVRSADRIYVMRAGQIVESGSHEELMAQDGTYAGLFRLQAASYTDDSGTLRCHPDRGRGPRSNGLVRSP